MTIQLNVPIKRPYIKLTLGGTVHHGDINCGAIQQPNLDFTPR
jgi:hypothetical protein